MKGKNKEIHTVNKTQNCLSFPDFIPFDHLKNCPRYTSILNRPEGNGVGIEEIDTLQMELESLLVNVMQRTRQLKLETMILDDWNSDKTSESSLSRIHSMSSPMPSEKQSNLTKKFKSFSGKPSTPLHSKSMSKTANIIHEDLTLPIVRNDIPDTFWQSVEPYCADITEDDIKMLEHQFEIQDSYMSMHRMHIPPLGKHYSVQWAEEDVRQQVREGSRMTEYEAKISTPSKKEKSSEGKYAVINPLVEDTMNKVGRMPALGKSVRAPNQTNQPDSLQYGPLTQRLISALIEQNLMTPLDNEIGDYLDKIGPPPQPMYMSPKTMARKFGNGSMTSMNNNNNNASSSSSLERKIKKTLIEQSILDDDMSDDSSVSDAGPDGKEADDEVALEIKSLQDELKTVTGQCKMTLGSLMEVSKQSMVKQEMRKKISLLDSEIYEIYTKIKVARLQKKPLFKKDREKALKAVKDRKLLKSQLNNL